MDSLAPQAAPEASIDSSVVQESGKPQEKPDQEVSASSLPSRPDPKMPLSSQNIHPSAFYHQHQSGSSSSTFSHGVLTPPNVVRNAAADFPPPLPVPAMADVESNTNGMPLALKTSSSSTRGPPGPQQGSTDSLISQFAGVAMNAGRACSRGPEILPIVNPVSSKKRLSPEKMQCQSQHPISNHPRLKVEDAVGYLDQVKNIFGHRPKVYNDFLDIMKEFKSQSLDTPGVITRVASLFRGHLDLIVGFNSFLPHGYRIDIGADEIIRVTIPGNQTLTISDMLPPCPALDTPPPEPVSEARPPGRSHSSTSTVSADSDSEEKLVSADTSLERSALEECLQADMDNLCNSGDEATSSGLGDLDSVRAAGTSTGYAFNYAMNYVNKIKDRFGMEPGRYKRFLEILHAHQSKIRANGGTVDETGVSREVARLFHDHQDLMDDFSKFLPACSASTARSVTPPTIATTSSTRTTSPSRSSSPQPAFSTQTSGRGLKRKSTSKQHGSKTKAETPVSAAKSPASSSTSVSAKTEAAPKLPPPAKTQRDNNCGKRSKGQKTKAYDDPDEAELPAQSSAKRFKQQSCKDSRGTPGKQEPVEVAKKGPRRGLVVEKSGTRGKEVATVLVISPAKPANSVRAPEDNFGFESGQSRSARNKRTTYPVAPPVQRKKLRRLAETTTVKKVFQPTKMVSTLEAFAYSTIEDFSLMDRIHRAVPDGVWNVLLKMFQIYTSRAITKGKLLQIVEKLLAHKPKLIQEFATFLQTKALVKPGSVMAAPETNRPRPPLSTISNFTASGELDNRRMALLKNKEPESRIAEIDFKAFERFTESRSYRIRPDHFPKRKSSGSSPMDMEVLNDKFVSCPIFSEGSQFLISKKNGAEEVMFKCEDEKYEMDMLLAATGSAIDAMTCMLDQVNNGKHQKWNEAFQHRRIITKLYTHNAPSILKHLAETPGTAIPTVLERLKQKYQDWIRVQNCMGDVWMEQARRNASKIGDYKGATFKQMDMRFLRSRHLVHEMDKLYNARLGREPKGGDSSKKQKAIDEHSATARSIPGTVPSTSAAENDSSSSGVGAVDGQPHLTVTYPKSLTVLDDVTFFVLRYIKQCSSFTPSDKQLMNKFLLEYLFRCFKIPDSSDPSELYDSSDDETDSDGNSPRIRRPCVPRLLSSSSDEDETEKVQAPQQNQGKRSRLRSSEKSDDESPSHSSGNGSKSCSHGSKEFPIAPLPWPELCQYSAEFRPLDSQVIEVDLSMESKKREIVRQRIFRKLSSEMGDSLPKEDSSYVLIYGSSPFFLFVRYHQLLCERFATLFRSFQNGLKMEAGRIETPSYIVSRACKPRIDIPAERFWSVFTDRLLRLLDGNIDTGNFEEEMREIFRKDAYLTFTLDRLIQSVARQLHHIIAQERAKAIRTFWEEARVLAGTGGLIAQKSERCEAEKQYEAKVSEFLKDQNCFKIVVFNSGRVAMELTDSEEPEDQQPLVRNWKDFVSYHAATARLDEPVKTKLLTERPPVFLARYHRQLSKHKHQLTRGADDEEEEEEDLMLDSTKLSDPEATADFSLDDKSWLMSLNIRSQIESDDIIGYKDDRTPNSHWLVYRRGSLQTAEETHRRVSQRRTAAFKRYLTDVWMKKALITPEKHKMFLNVMHENMNKYKQGNSVGAPYFVYYVCKSDDAKRLEKMQPFWVNEDQEPDDVEISAEGKDEDVADMAQDSDSSDNEEKDEDTETETDSKKIGRKTTPVG